MGVIGNQYRLDKLKNNAESAMNKYYIQLNDIEKIKAAGGAVSELVYKTALDLEKQASQAQHEVSISSAPAQTKNFVIMKHEKYLPRLILTMAFRMTRTALMKAQTSFISPMTSLLLKANSHM